MVCGDEILHIFSKYEQIVKREIGIKRTVTRPIMQTTGTATNRAKPMPIFLNIFPASNFSLSILSLNLEKTNKTIIKDAYSIAKEVNQSFTFESITSFLLFSSL